MIFCQRLAFVTVGDSVPLGEKELTHPLTVGCQKLRKSRKTPYPAIVCILDTTNELVLFLQQNKRCQWSISEIKT
jgi:hypothetical protein